MSLTEEQIAEKIYREAGLGEKIGLHAHTLFSLKGWDYLVSYLPDPVEAQLRSGWNWLASKTENIPILNWIFQKTDEKPKSPEQVVIEKTADVVRETSKGTTPTQYAVQSAIEGLASPIGIVATEAAANAIGSKLVAATASKGAKAVDRFVATGLAGAFEGATEAGSITYATTKSPEQAVVAAAFGAGAGFLSAGTFGALMPAPTPKPNAATNIRKAGVLGTAYTLDFPGEILGDVVSTGLEKGLRTKVVTVTPSTTSSSTSLTQTNTQTKTNVQTQTNIPSSVPSNVPNLANVFLPSNNPTNIITNEPIIGHPTEVPIPQPVPEPNPSNVPNNVPVPEPTPSVTPTVTPTPKTMLIPPLFPAPSSGIAIKGKSKFADDVALTQQIISALI